MPASVILSNLDVVVSASSTGQAFGIIHFSPGSLAEHVATNFVARLQGRLAATAIEMFSSPWPETTHIVRNTNFWLGDLPEITAYCAVRGYSLPAGSNFYGVNATLITRRHFLQCKHNRVPNGWPVVYVTRNNQRVVRTVRDWQPVGKCDTNVFNGRNDCLIVQQLNEAVPDGIVPLKLLPADASRYLGEHTPYVSGHYSKRFGVAQHPTAPFATNGRWDVFYPLGRMWPDWYVPVGAGDSGSTSEYIIHGHLVLVNTAPADILNAVQALNTRHGTTNLPDVVDLSMFPKFR